MRILLPVIAAGLLLSNFAHAAETSFPGNSPRNTSNFSSGRALGLDLAFSDESANLEVLSPLRRFTRGKAGGTLESKGLSSLGFFFNELDDVVGHIKLVAVGNQAVTRIPYQLEFGLKGYLGRVKQDDTDVGAIAIGGAIKIQNPFSRRPVKAVNNPIDLKVEGFFTPGITTFGDTDSLLEINARLSVEIVPAAKAFIGYRLLEVENESAATLELDDNIHFGFRAQF